MYTVYVLKSIHFDKIYIGFTSDLNARLIAHNHPANKGWTHKFQPWEIKYTETFDNKSEAMKREKQLKSAKGREFIKNLIFLRQFRWTYIRQPADIGFESFLRNIFEESQAELSSFLFSSLGSYPPAGGQRLRICLPVFQFIFHYLYVHCLCAEKYSFR